MTQGLGIQFGIAGEWEHFSRSHQLFFERFPSLQAALNIAFIRGGESSEPVDRVVFFASRLCVEDFMEILLLCGNGYGFGALKLLRGMYERCVTAWYLHRHPDKTEDFFDFHAVSQYKLAQAIKDTVGEDALPKEKFQELKLKRDEVRARFMVTSCDKCGTQRENFTWTKLDFVSMARDAGAISKLIVPAYYLPTRQAHSTVAAILSRLKAKEGGGLSFDEGPQREEAGEALRRAHNVLLTVLDLQKEHFKLGELEEPLQKCVQDFLDIWHKLQSEPSGQETHPEADPDRGPA